MLADRNKTTTSVNRTNARIEMKGLQSYFYTVQFDLQLQISDLEVCMSTSKLFDRD